MERRTFIGTVMASALGPLVSQPSTATSDIGTPFEYPETRSDITVENAVFTGSFTTAEIQRFLTAHETEVYSDDSPHPGQHIRIPSGPEDDQYSLMTLYEGSQKFILRTDPESDDIPYFEQEFARVVSEAGISPTEAVEDIDVANLVAVGDLDLPDNETISLEHFHFFLRGDESRFHDISYQPEVFPALTMKLEELSVILYANGTVILPGGTSTDDVLATKDAVDDVYEEFQTARTT